MEIKDLKANQKNPRKISKESLAGLKASLEKFGDLSGVIYNRRTDRLVGGHQRVKIFSEYPSPITIDQKLDEPDSSGTLVYGHFYFNSSKFSYREVFWDEPKEAQANLAANNPEIQGVFDLELLPDILELAKLEDGFDLLELAPLEELLIGNKKVEEIEEEEIPEIPVDPISQLGDVWELISEKVKHKIVCGSSTDFDLFKPQTNFIDLVFTDPPYGVDITKAGKGSSINNGKYIEIAGDKDTKTAQDFYNNCDKLGISKMILWGGNYFTDFLPPSRCWIIWDKKTGKGMSFARGEMAWTSFDKNMEIYEQSWTGNLVGKVDMEKEGITKEIINGSTRSNRLHPTQKPVTMQAQIIEDFAPEAKNILDGFLGSGSMLIACQATNRNCYGFEVIPAYVDVAIIRWIKYCKKNNLPAEVKKNGEITEFLI